MAENLDQLLTRSGLVSEAGLAVARADAARTRKRLPEALIDLGLVDERRFAEWMAQVSHTPFVAPIPRDEATAVRQHINGSIVRELQAVPLRFVEDQLFVVLVNPLDSAAIELLQSAAGVTVRAMTGVRSDIARAVSELFAIEEAPFDFSNETLMRRPAELDFLREPAQAFGTVAAVPLPEPESEIGEETMYAPRIDMTGATPDPDDDLGTNPPVGAEPFETATEDATSPTDPLVEVNRRLDQIVRMIRRLEERLEHFEVLLHEQREPHNR